MAKDLKAITRITRTEECGTRSETYHRILDNLTWRLHGRPLSEVRSLWPKTGKPFEAVLHGPGGDLQIHGTIRNVCRRTSRGFCLETSDIIIDRYFDREVGRIRETVEPFPCRRIEATRADGGENMMFDRVDLHVSWARQGVEVEMRLSCKIIRGWPLADRQDMAACGP